MRDCGVTGLSSDQPAAPPGLGNAVEHQNKTSQLSKTLHEEVIVNVKPVHSIAVSATHYPLSGGLLQLSEETKQPSTSISHLSTGLVAPAGPAGSL